MSPPVIIFRGSFAIFFVNETTFQVDRNMKSVVCHHQSGNSVPIIIESPVGGSFVNVFLEL